METYLKALSPKGWLSCLVKPYQNWTNELYRMEFFRGSLGFSLWIRGRCSRMRQCRNEWPRLTTFLDVSFTMMYQHTSLQRTSLWTALFLTTTWYIPGENKEMKINGEMCQAVDFRLAVTVCYSVHTTLCLEAIKGLSYLACTQVHLYKPTNVCARMHAHSHKHTNTECTVTSLLWKKKKFGGQLSDINRFCGSYFVRTTNSPLNL